MMIFQLPIFWCPHRSWCPTHSAKCALWERRHCMLVTNLVTRCCGMAFHSSTRSHCRSASVVVLVTSMRRRCQAVVAAYGSPDGVPTSLPVFDYWILPEPYLYLCCYH